MHILFLHGFAAGGAVWEPYRSEFPDARMPTLQCSGDGEPILPELDEPAILVGWSMGAMLAVELLRRQPQFVKGLVLVSSSPSFVVSDVFPEGKAPSAVRELRDAITKGDPKGLQGFQKQLFTAAEIRDGWL
ncbi:MAG TPA: alpha/beta hydrolase, partial [bacterium]|nr:alpha/beta hydrolase [bacterium]